MELAGGREVEGEWGEGEDERVAQPCPTSPPGVRVMEGGPQHPSSNIGPPILGERDMAFPRVSSPLPLGVETKKREGRGRGDCVCQGRTDQLVCPPQHTHPPKP